MELWSCIAKAGQLGNSLSQWGPMKMMEIRADDGCKIEYAETRRKELTSNLGSGTSRGVEDWALPGDVEVSVGGEGVSCVQVVRKVGGGRWMDDDDGYTYVLMAMFADEAWKCLVLEMMLDCCLWRREENGFAERRKKRRGWRGWKDIFKNGYARPH